MPTGYTSIIEDKEGTTFREYALRCARGMGVCIMQRDEDLDVPPRPREPDDYHTKAIASAKGKLAELAMMSPEAAQALYDATCEQARTQNEKYAAEHTRKQAAYARVRAGVVAWKPPTPDHDGVKRFMLEQIDLCYRPDEKPYETPVPANVEAYLASLRDMHEQQIPYHEEQLAKEVARVEESRSWLAAFVGSLPP